MDRCHGHGDLLVADVSAVCIGYIFFRAESVHQAFAMLKALVSPHGYTHWNLDPSFYMLTLLAAAGTSRSSAAVFYSIIWRRPRALVRKPRRPLVELARHPGQRTLGVDHSRDRGAGNLFERDFPARPRRNRAVMYALF